MQEHLSNSQRILTDLHNIESYKEDQDIDLAITSALLRIFDDYSSNKKNTIKTKKITSALFQNEILIKENQASIQELSVGDLWRSWRQNAERHRIMRWTIQIEGCEQDQVLPACRVMHRIKDCL